MFPPTPPVTPLVVSVCIASAFVLLALAETLVPARPAQRRRWLVNLSLGVTNSLVVRLLSIAGPAATALWAQSADFGLFRQIDFDGPWAIAASVILLDLALYWQHRAMHSHDWLWAVHRLHHADPAMDISTGLRFNPAEAILSMAYKSLVVAVFGLPVLAVFLFEAWIAIGSFFEHSNLRLAPRWDRQIRRLWVTPAMHLVHHSAHGDDHNHNYGFAIALWDHLFKTHKYAASGATIGLPHGGAAG